MRRPRAIVPRLALLVLLIGPWTAGEAARVRADDGSDSTRVPDPTLMLHGGDDVRLTDLGDGPYVVVPIFTRCRAVCSLVAKRLTATWNELGEDSGSAPIVLVSFDPADTRADMTRFGELFDLPRSWHLATMEREEGLAFFSALGFQWRTLSGRQFDHSGKIFVLTDDLQISSVIGPDQLTAGRFGAELSAARNGVSLARRIGSHWVGLFGVGVILLTLVVAVTWEKLRWRQHGSEPGRTT